MILRILFLSIFIFCGNMLNGQSPQWYLQATMAAEFSHYKSPFNIKDSLANSSEKDRSSGFNYELGGIIGYQVNRSLSFESGIHLLIREDKNIDRTLACSSSGEVCAFLSSSILKKRYHIFEVPLSIRWQ